MVRLAVEEVQLQRPEAEADTDLGTIATCFRKEVRRPAHPGRPRAPPLLPTAATEIAAAKGTNAGKDSARTSHLELLMYFLHMLVPCYTDYFSLVQRFWLPVRQQHIK